MNFSKFKDTQKKKNHAKCRDEKKKVYPFFLNK